MADTRKKQDADLDDIGQMRRRYTKADEVCRDPYSEALQDIEFVTVPGKQWDEKLKARRGERNCYEFPKLQGHIRQIINEMRQQRPQGKVRGVGADDTGLAEIMQGLCRNIESVSNADMAYDAAYMPAVKGGFGVWRVCTDYESDDSFDQEIFVRPIRNPFCAKCDPAAVEIDRRDARFWFIGDTMARSQFEAEFPEADLAGFDLDPHCLDFRADRDKVVVLEYLYKRPMKRDLLALSDGRIVYADSLPGGEDELQANGVQVVNRRKVNSHKVYSRMTNGHEWLTEATEIPCKFIPIIPVWGQIDNINGEDYWQGATRSGKDQQRLHNVHRTAAIEAVAKSPKAPFLVKLKWIKGLERFWNKANAEDYPYLPVNDEADQMPVRAQQAEVPAALIQLAGMDNDDIKAATGIYDASLGARSNETSGIAIGQRKQQGAVATFNYSDNLANAIRFQYEILIDMIPRVYDTPRVKRIIGADGGETWKQLYQTVTDPHTGEQTIVNDISKGKYDVTVTVGPSYATQRMESVDAFAQLAGQVGPISPQLGELLAYQVIKNMDLPGSEEVAEALRKQLVQQGLLPPKEGEQPPQQQPNPQLMAQVEKLQAEVQRIMAETQKTQVETQIMAPKAMADIDKTKADAHQTHLQNVHQVLAGGPPMQMPPTDAAPPGGQDSGPPPGIALPGAQPQQLTPPQGGFFSL